VSSSPPLRLLSVIIPARDEEGCISSTVEHLHLELALRGVPHEIIVIDDGSTDRTWQILQEEARRLNTSTSVAEVSNSGLSPHEPREVLRAIRNPGPHGFGRAITLGLDVMTGDAAVIFMADESDSAAAESNFIRRNTAHSTLMILAAIFIRRIAAHGTWTFFDISAGQTECVASI
jgi:dolichol-phosphate mannosyltransferase